MVYVRVKLTCTIRLETEVRPGSRNRDESEQYEDLHVTGDEVAAPQPFIQSARVKVQLSQGLSDRYSLFVLAPLIRQVESVLI